MPPLLLSPTNLRALLSTQSHRVRVLDATWFMPNSPRNALSEHTVSRLPGAMFWDVDRIASNHPLGLKHMMPDPTLFRKACGEFGLKPDNHVVIYDSHGVFSSPRTLFTFRAFGHERSSVLDGGLPAWEAEGYDLEASAPGEKFPPTDYSDSLQDATQLVKSYEQMVENSKLSPDNVAAVLVLDARSAGRFTGKDPEPRPGLSSGHIPFSFSLPFNRLLQQNTSPGTGKTYTTMLKPTGLEKVFREVLGDARFEAILSGKQAVVNTCGSGMTASVIWLALEILKVRSSIYDESWTGAHVAPLAAIHGSRDMSKSTAELEVLKGRILSHMNADHQRELIHYLRHFNGLSLSKARGCTLEDITLDGITIKTRNGKEHIVSFEPPMGSLSEARERLIHMDRQAREALGISLTLSDFTLPTFGPHLFAGPLGILSLGLVARAYGQLHPRIWAGVGAVLGLQAVWFDYTRLRKYDVDRWTSLWYKWMVSVVFEGYGTWQRIDRMAKEKEQRRKH